jgi:predicted ATPase with chaperone activity
MHSHRRCSTNDLAPADVKKEGPSFDLQVTGGMPTASNPLQSDDLDTTS